MPLPPEPTTFPVTMYGRSMHLALAETLASAATHTAIRNMIYTHVLNRGGRGVVSPLDR